MFPKPRRPAMSPLRSRPIIEPRALPPDSLEELRSRKCSLIPQSVKSLRLGQHELGLVISRVLGALFQVGL
jgi:hypothetical protein